MKLVQIVILLGPQCVSPMQHTPGMTEVSQVPCAIVIERQTETGSIAVKPDWQAGNPIVALLSERQTLVSMEGLAKTEVKSAASVSDLEADRQHVIPRPQPRPLVAARPAARDTRALKIAPQAIRKKAAKKISVARRTDRCGSMRAAWYTNKQGQRRYRCVR